MTIKKRLITGVAIGLLLIGGIAVGAVELGIPNSDGIISSCYDQKGNLRVVTDPGQCTAREKTLVWHQVGQAGPQGPAGPAGPQGEQGIPGAPGPAASGTVLRANVIWHFDPFGPDEWVVNGDATEVEYINDYTGPGVNVKFAQNISACTAVATPGGVGGSVEDAVLRVYPGINLAGDSRNRTVAVHFSHWQNTAPATGFQLIVVCD